MDRRVLRGKAGLEAEKAQILSRRNAIKALTLAALLPTGIGYLAWRAANPPLSYDDQVRNAIASKPYLSRALTKHKQRSSNELLEAAIKVEELTKRDDPAFDYIYRAKPNVSVSVRLPALTRQEIQAPSGEPFRTSSGEIISSDIFEPKLKPAILNTTGLKTFFELFGDVQGAWNKQVPQTPITFGSEERLSHIYMYPYGQWRQAITPQYQTYVFQDSTFEHDTIATHSAYPLTMSIPWPNRDTTFFVAQAFHDVVDLDTTSSKGANLSENTFLIGGWNELCNTMVIPHSYNGSTEELLKSEGRGVSLGVFFSAATQGLNYLDYVKTAAYTGKYFSLIESVNQNAPITILEDKNLYNNVAQAMRGQNIVVPV
jgi:hypothetical protein